MRIIGTGTISTDEKAGNFANRLEWCILVPAILNFAVCYLRVIYSLEISHYEQRLFIRLL